jgi:hypothetical protein
VPDHRFAERHPAGAGDADRRAKCGDRQRHQRPGDRDLELGRGRVGVALHRGEAAEDPELDVGDADPAAQGDEGVAQLVQQDRSEEADRRRDRQCVRGGRAAFAQQVAVEARGGDQYEEDDDEPRPVDADPDSAHVKEGYRASSAHFRSKW